MQTELIAGTGANAVSLDLTEDIPISLNFNIADVRTPEKRLGSFSKTINIYGTKTNNDFFEHIYNVNIVTNTFNRNLFTPCYILQEGSVIFEGNLRLLRITKILQNNIEEITYEVAIYGDSKTLFAEIGDDKLEDLDLSAYDHTYNRATQYATWAAAQGVGYCYPIIDYGFNAFATNKFKVEWLKPAIYVKQYIDTIFSTVGKTYTSTFLNTSFFKSLIIPHNGDKFTMNSNDKQGYEFYVGMTGSGTADNTTLNYISAGNYENYWHSTAPSVSNYSLTAIWNDESTTPFFDTGGNYNPTTGVISPTCVNGYYNLDVNLKTDIKFNSSDANFSQTYNTAFRIRARLYKRATSTSSWFWVSQQDVAIPLGTNFTTSYLQINTPLTFANVGAWIGNEFKILVDLITNSPNAPIYMVDAGLNPINSGSTNSYDMRMNSASTFKFTLTKADYVNGQTINMTDAIPKDVKQKDFLNSIIKMFNVYVDVDPTDSNNYIIEPRDDYYAGGTTKDWSDKLAWNEPFIIKPMSEVEGKKFIYKYKDDSDYYNKKYLDAYAESYAQYTLDVPNDFTKNENKTEVMFSATPVVDNPLNDLIIPKIFQYDGTTVKPSKHNLRILMFNGTVSNSIPYIYSSPTNDALGGTFNVNTNEYEALMSSYGQAAMVDDPENPTESIEFGVPNEVYYTPTTYTDNHLYNRFYSRFMNEITDRDSMIVECSMYLEPSDISSFDFRDRIYVKDTYYLVNKIMSYNPIKKGLTKVELLKLKDYDAFQSTTSEITVIETNSGNTGMTARTFGLADEETNINNANNVIIGSANRSSSQGSFVSGENNTIGSDSYRITMVSCDNNVVTSNVSGCILSSCSGCIVSDSAYNITLNNCYDVYVEPTVHDFVGIGLSGVTITTADNGTVNIGSQAAPVYSSATKTANFNVDYAIQLYYIDCTGGNITATFDISTCANKVFYFVRTDASANTFSIDEVTGTPLVSGNPVPFNTGMLQYDSLTISNNGSNFFII